MRGVYYNALNLSEVLAELENRGELASAEVLKRVSPVAWQHINFYGCYEFDADFTPIDFARPCQQLFSEDFPGSTPPLTASADL